jgi:protein TonB
MSVSTYRAIVNAQISSHTHYPESARLQGVSGHVTVAFSIGGAGRVTSAYVVASSGAGALDSAAVQAVRAIQVPPPPGGSFSGSKSFNFNLH